MSRSLPFRLRPLAVLASLAFAAPAWAATPTPEIQRPAASAQALNVAHTVRTIPEACTRLEGSFAANAATPYALKPVRTSANCQARARFVDATKVKPSTASGWILNDIVRIPSAACTSQQAVVQVWRKPADKAAPPTKDAQGRARIYLQDAKKSAQANTLNAIPQFAAVLSMEGTACRAG